VKLPIDVCDTNLIEIDEGERAHATSSESLNGPRSDTAEPNHTHGGASDSLISLGAHELSESKKTVMV
jgi:hypothetical protein